MGEYPSSEAAKAVFSKVLAHLTLHEDARPVVIRLDSYTFSPEVCLPEDCAEKEKRCPDCGAPGETRGHMTCQYPSNL
jgi:hypothetical protein